MNREIDNLLKKIDNSKKNTEKLEEKNQFLQAENEFFKEELKSHELKKEKLSFSKEILSSLPLEMSNFIQEKELESDLENLMINPQDLLIKKKIGSGGFATVHKFFLLLLNFKAFFQFYL